MPHGQSGLSVPIVPYTPSVGKVVAMQHRWLIKNENNSGGTYWMFHEMLPFKHVLTFELNLCCTCTVSTDNGCRFIHLCGPIPGSFRVQISVLFWQTPIQWRLGLLPGLVQQLSAY